MFEDPAKRRVAHFLVGGAVLFVLSQFVPTTGSTLSSPPDTGPVEIVFDDARLDVLRERYEQQTGLDGEVATPDELVEENLEEELLYHEALRRGLDQYDRSVRYRLIDKMRFIVGHDEELPEDELYRRAKELDLGRDDLILRRMLSMKMRLVIQKTAGIGEVLENDLTDYLNRHADDFRQPPRVSFTQLFFSRDKRGKGGAHAAAAEFLETLAPTDSGAADEAQSDPSPWKRNLGRQAPADLDRSWGSEFSAAIFAMESGRWLGPIDSTFGSHLIFVRDVEPAALPPLDEVRSRVEASLKNEREKAAYHKELDAIRERYVIRIEPGAGS